MLSQHTLLFLKGISIIVKWIKTFKNLFKIEAPDTVLNLIS